MKSVNKCYFGKNLIGALVFWTTLFFSTFIYAEKTNVVSDSISRFSTMINSKPQKIWPLLFQPERWKWVAEHKNVHLSGDKERGVVAIYGKKGADSPTLFLKTLRIEQYKYYGFSIYSVEEEFLGFGAFILEEKNNQTHLSYEIYLHQSLGIVTQQEARKINEKRQVEMEQRQPRELATLKQLAEETS